jgi:hypothetical protein
MFRIWLCRAGVARLFCLRAKFLSKVVWRAAKNWFFSFLSQNYVNLRCFLKMNVQQTWQCIYNQTHWGPQKTFGGPHAARGPQFGHLCYMTSKCYNLSIYLNSCVFFALQYIFKTDHHPENIACLYGIWQPAFLK